MSAAPKITLWCPDCGHTHGALSRAVEVVDIALREVGRPDLAELVGGWDDDDGQGFYLTVDEVVLDDRDWTIIDKAENLARQAIGQPPMVRNTPSLTGSPSPRVEPVERPVGHPLSRRGNNDGDRR